MKSPLVLCIALSVLSISFAAGAATYYVDATAGSDSYNGTSTSSPWKTIAKVNGIRFNAGDSVLFKRGEMWREQLTIKYGGTASAPITYGAYGSGAAPVICGSNAVTGWAQSDTNVWRATLGTDPKSLWYVLTDGTFAWGGRKNSTSELTAQYDWTWAAGYLYVLCSSNPSTAYRSVEAGAREYCVFGGWGANADYVKVQDFELRFTVRKLLSAPYGGSTTAPTNDYWTVERNVGHHCGVSMTEDMLGFDIHGYGHVVRNNTIYEAIGNGIYVGFGGNNVVEYNTCYNNHHHGVDVKSMPGIPCDNNIVRYNTIYESGMQQNVSGILYTSGSSSNLTGGIFTGVANNTEIYGNVVWGTSEKGIQIGGSNNAASVNTMLYNNVVYNCRSYHYYLDCSSQKVTMRNNISLGSTALPLRVTDAANKDIDYNCWQSSGTRTAGIGSTYYSSWTAYKSATGWDAHSVFADPMFANAAGHDFRLQAGSPCIDKGVSVGVTVDAAGTSIPQGAAPDMGVFEKTSATTGDTTKPVITLLGSASMTIQSGSTFTDPGVTATDDRDGDITSRVVKSGTVNTGAVGTYTITYTVSDTAGNAATPVKRTVTVVDTTKPVITLVGQSSVTIDAGSTYTDAGATARDNVDGDITSRITKTGTVNTAVAGTYTITYNVSDSSGNAATPVSRTVVVQTVSSGDTTKPVITLVGSAAVTVQVGETFTDPGATATDNVDGNITSRIVVSGAVDTETAGAYTLAYNVSDTAGNAATPVTRTVTVVAVTPPPTGTLTISSPVNGSQLYVPAGMGGIALTVAAGTDASVESVEFKLDGVSLGVASAKPYAVTADVQVEPGAHQIAATAKIAGSTQTLSATSSLNVIAVTAQDDADQNGLPDNVLALLKNNGDTWYQAVKTSTGKSRASVVARFTPEPAGVPVTVAIENPDDSARSIKLTVPRNIIKSNEIGLLVVNMAGDLDTLAGSAAVNLRPEPGGVQLAAGGQYFHMAIITSSNGGSSFVEMVAPFAAAIDVEMAGLGAGAAALQGHPEYLFLNSYGLQMGASAGDWSANGISNTAAVGGKLTAKLTVPGIFAPYQGAAASDIQVTTAALPGAYTYLTYYRQALAASGGTAPYMWSLASGTLPPGLTMNANGLISGRATRAGMYTFTVRATDATGATATKSLYIYIRSIFG